MSDTFTYEAPAKLNLYLDVISRRDDGYHDIETVFQTISLWDRLTFSPGGTRTQLTVSGIKVPVSSDNLILKAAALLEKAAGRKSPVAIHLEKRIPVAAGLGGGSSDAAATLLALNRIWNLNWDGRKLARLASELGADVPYFLKGGTLVAVGRGDETIRSFQCRQAWFVLVFPPFGLSTREVYTHPALKCSHRSALGSVSPECRRAAAAWQKRRWSDTLYNALELPALALRPELGEIKERLLREGCAGALMSGSGSTVFGVCPGRAEASAAAEAMERAGYATMVVSSAPRGCRALGFV